MKMTPALCRRHNQNANLSHLVHHVGMHGSCVRECLGYVRTSLPIGIAVCSRADRCH